MAWPIHVSAMELRSVRLSQCHDQVRPWATNTAVRWDWIVGARVTFVRSAASSSLPPDLAWLLLPGGVDCDFRILPGHVDHDLKFLKLHSASYTQPRRCLWMFVHERGPCVSLVPSTCRSLAENKLLQVTLWSAKVPTRVLCNGVSGQAPADLFVEVVAVSTAVLFHDMMEHFQDVALCPARWRDLWLIVDACRHHSFGTALADHVVLQQPSVHSLISSCPLTAFFHWGSGDASSPSLTSDWRFLWVRPGFPMPLVIHGRLNAIAASRIMFAALTRLLCDAWRGSSHLSPFVQRLLALRNTVQFGGGHSNLLCWNSWVELQTRSLMDAPLLLFPIMGPAADEGSSSPSEEPGSPTSLHD